METNIEYTGLAQARAERIKRESEKTIKRKPHKFSALKLFAGQFHDAMVIILLAASAISVLVGQWRDAVPIMLIVVMNAALGFFQEYRCEKTLEQMKRLAAPTAKAYRDGRLKIIPAEDVVVEDLIEVEAGDKFPCDCIILSQSALSCDESALTGESVPAVKTAYKNEPDRASLNLPYMGYMGTTVLKGRARCIASAVGSDTQMGAVSDMLSSIEEEQTPLQVRLGELGRVLAAICLGVCVLVFAAGVIRGEKIGDMFFTAVTVAIAAIPEGLPAAVTIALAVAVRRMLKQNALVRRLHSVETLGCASVICTDKTGTLTQGKMTVNKLFTLSGKTSEYEYFGKGDRIRESLKTDRVLLKTLVCAAMCSNARIAAKGGVAQESRRNRHKPKYVFDGDPTEAALLEMCTECGVNADKTGLVRTDEKPFDSETKYMSVTCRRARDESTSDAGEIFVFLKGAPEVIAEKCGYRYDGADTVPLTESDRASIIAKNNSYAGEGLRVIALCESVGGKSVFLALAALSDPLREGAADAVRECHTAGIDVVMITGDHMLTACSVARQAGILTPSKRAVSGAELDKMTNEELERQIKDIAVYARVTPAHKLRIVRAVKSGGRVCAMTGDGVNDAPAVKEASVGVAMGISGTDVTKQAADMVLLDDNFSTLVSAVREGRAIYSNIQRFVRYLIACNIGEVLTVLGAIIMGLPSVLAPSQLLLINLVTDGLPAAALSVERPMDEMKKPPRDSSEGFFTGGLMTKMLARGIFIAMATLACFTLLLTNGFTAVQSRTGAMLTLILAQLLYALECRAERKRLFGGYVTAAVLSSAVCVAVCMGISSLAEIFSLKPLSAAGYAVVAATGAAATVISLIARVVKRSSS